MKVELKYNPIKPETISYIDGVKTKSNDIYGFLYPVRFFTLQTWLYADGSWTGLVKQLYDLAKGEEINLIFCGREVDYKDLQTAMEGCENITLSYKKWNLLNELEIRERELKNHIEILNLNEISDYISEKKYNEHTPNESDWLTCIDSEEDYENAVALKCRKCFYVTENFLDSYPKLEMLARLNRGMRIPRDAICCVFDREETRSAFAKYAAMFFKLQFRFVLKSDKKWKDELFEKYGLPITKEKSYIPLMDYYKNLKDQVFKFIDNLPQIEKEYEILLEKKQDYGYLNTEDDNKFQKLYAYRSWIKKIRKNKQFSKLCYMIDSFDDF